MKSAWFYLTILAATGIISFFVSLYIRKWAINRNLTQKVRERDLHKKPLPRLGGLAIFISFFIVMLLFLIFLPSQLAFTENKFFALDRNLFGVILGALIILIVMLIDDLKGLRWSWKLAGQFAAAICVAGFGVSINWVNNPFSSMIILSKPILDLGLFTVSWGQIFVVLWIVLVMNVVNWLDGLDGLAGGIAIISATAIFLLAISPRIDQAATGLLALILIGSILGFMPFNWCPAKMFLGDTGSMFIGYMLGILAVISGGKVATASLVMGVALLDGIWVIVSRLIHRKSPFVADKNHIHHRLLRAGFSVKQSVVILYGVALAFGYLALRSGPEGKFWALIWLAGIMVLLSVGLTMLEWIHRRTIHS